MKTKIENTSKEAGVKNVLKTISGFIDRQEAFVVFLIFLIFIGYVGYLWYQYAYRYQWNDVKKQGYMSTKNEVNGFNKAKFENVLDNMNIRQEAYQKDMSGEKDIFKLK